jgi:hypothetical protein
LRVAGEPVDPGDLTDQLGRDQHAQALLRQQLWRGQPRAGIHEPLAMGRQQSNLELGSGEPGRRERLDALPERGASDRQRVNRIGLPTLTDPLPGLGHQPGREADDRLTAIDQEPLQSPGHVPDVLDHPHPLTVELARPLQQLTEPLTPSSDPTLRDLHPERVDRDPRVRLLVRNPPDRHHHVRPFVE